MPDDLRRQHFAEAIATQLTDLEPDERMVIALEGPWGSGKTWPLERVAEKLDRQVVVRFSPWLVGPADDRDSDSLRATLWDLLNPLCA